MGDCKMIFCFDFIIQQLHMAMTPNLPSLNYALHVKPYASHSKLAKFECIQCSRTFVFEIFNVAIEL